MIRRRKKKVSSSLSERLAKLQTWLQTDAGTVLLDSQRLLLEREINTIFGYHAGQFSVLPEIDLLATSPVRRKFILTPQALNDYAGTQLVADPYFWPVAQGSLDMVLLHHTLDVVHSPHRLLSEAANTIIPNGKLIIIGFNPASLSGALRWLIPTHRKMLSDVSYISPIRMRDWLKLLNFHIERVHFGGYLYPLSSMMKGLRGEILEQRCNHWQLPLGGFYMIVATRDIPGITPIIRPWRSIPGSLVGQTIPRPSGYHHQKK